MESIIERNCRKDGFDIFMPSYYTELRHHRTKQILQKRFPARHEQSQHLRGQLCKILPKGRKARVSMVEQAERAIDSLSPQIKERVQKSLSG